MPRMLNGRLQQLFRINIAETIKRQWLLQQGSSNPRFRGNVRQC